LKNAPIQAVIFDLDGTLVDSEKNTDLAVNALLEENGISPTDLDYESFYGNTWKQIAGLLAREFPRLAASSIEGRLQENFQARLLANAPALIPGAREAMSAASLLFPCAIVSTSNRESVQHIVDRHELNGYCSLIIAAEDMTRSKPDPECYHLASQRLQTTPDQFLVFEDSIAGLQAARRAGMWTVGITWGKAKKTLNHSQEIADLCIESFVELCSGFFEVMKRGVPDDWTSLLK